MGSGSLKGKTVLLALLLLAGLSLAGCLDAGEEDEEEAPPFEEPEPEPGPPELTLVLEGVGLQHLVGDMLQLNVTVTGDNTTADWAGIRWAMNSTADRVGENLTTAAFEGEVEANETVLLPGAYSVGWDLVDNGTFFVRAHVQANGTDYWSDEFELEVLPVVEEGDFDADLVIGIGPGVFIAPYSPDPAEISVGDAVAWENNDLVPHTATHDADDRLWHTGDIDAQASSEFSYRFNKAGTYEVFCTIHPDMSAEIVVS